MILAFRGRSLAVFIRRGLLVRGGLNCNKG